MNSIRKQTSHKKLVFFIIVIIVCVYFFLELSSFAIYSLVNHKIFSFQKFQTERLEIIAHTIPIPGQDQYNYKPGGEKGGVEEAIHPYLGFVRDPDKMTNHSQYGFFGNNSLLQPESSDSLIIAILGGSFAEAVSRESADVLIRGLGKSPKFQDRKIIIRTLALGGYKQPQQLMTLLYFLVLGTHFDIVINIDGFNEIALPPLENIPKHVHPLYPRAWFMRVKALSNPQLLLGIGTSTRLTLKRKQWAELFSTWPLRDNIISNLIWLFYDQRVSRQIGRIKLALQRYRTDPERESDYYATGPDFHFESDAALFRYLAEVWKRCSLQMFRICRANGIGYFHFLQPNQYIPGSKVIKEEEMKIAFWENQPYRESVKKGYPYLIEFGNDLISQGVYFKDLTMLFKNNDEILYKDTCCHLNKKGYRLIAAAIVDYILSKESGDPGRGIEPAHGSDIVPVDQIN